MQLTNIFLFLQGEGHNLNYLGLSMYDVDVTNRLIQVASILEGLKIIEKKTFRVENFEYVSHIYVGPDIATKQRENEFCLYERTADLKRMIVPVQKFHVEPFLFLPYLQKRQNINHRLPYLS